MDNRRNKDSIELFKPYKGIKEMSDLMDEIKKLRDYYSRQQYDQMLQLINVLTEKYFIETTAWNSGHPIKPVTYQQHYENAEAFLRSKGNSILVEKGINV